MKIATGISGFCPMLHVLNLSTKEVDAEIKDMVKKVPQYVDEAVDDLGLDME